MDRQKKLVLKNSDYTAYKKKNSSLVTDYLTGLPNRRALYEYYSGLEKNTTVHILFIDIDNFKRVNDVYGHSEGDKLLCCVGDFLQNEVDKSRIFRIGGDEFVAVIDGRVSEEDLIANVTRIKKRLHNLGYRKDILSLISLSIGVLAGQSVDQVLDEVLNKCDSAMYQAKSDGKNRFVLYKTLEKSIEINKTVESEMDSALKNGEFQVFYQPKVNMINMTMYGAEALVRWIHPETGLRAPMQFIPLFEKNGFITKLDMYVFEEVCKMKQRRIGSGVEHLKVSVNMSRLHLYHRDFPRRLKAIADKYGVPTEELEIEITESTFFKDTSELIYMVEKLRNTGFSVSIDDFGSGYSALNMLKDIPASTIKIDKEFLKLSSDNYRGKKVIKNIIVMCKELKFDVVAEGVETKEQVDFLTSCGCEIAQGYLYSKPIPEDEFIKYAQSLLVDHVKPVVFTLDGTIKSEDGKYEAVYSIDEEDPKPYEFVPGIYKNSKAVRLYGGIVEKNCFELPEALLKMESYTISMWIYTENANAWTATLYAKYETGFIAIVPNAWEGHASFRLRDSKNVDGWHDAAGCQFPEKQWVHATITYNAKTETMYFYVNGEILSRAEEIPTVRFCKRIILGGDVFQRSFDGRLCEVKFFSQVLGPTEVKEHYREYIDNPDFTPVITFAPTT